MVFIYTPLGGKKIYNNGGMPDSYGEKYAQ